MRYDFPFYRFEGLLHRLYYIVFQRCFRAYGQGAFVSPYSTVLGVEHIRMGARSSVGRRSLLVIVPQPGGGASQITGHDIYVGRGCTLSACSNLELGDRITLGDKVYVSAGQHGFGDPGANVLEQHMQTGVVRIEDGAFVSGTTSVTIGYCGIVAANAVMTKDVPAITMVGGVPARPMRRFDPELKEWLRVAPLETSHGG